MVDCYFSRDSEPQTGTPPFGGGGCAARYGWMRLMVLMIMMAGHGRVKRATEAEMEMEMEGEGDEDGDGA